jgi:hypothetical protein
MSTDTLVELGRRFQIWFLDWVGGEGRHGLINAEGELHSSDGSGLSILAGLSVTLFFHSPLLDQVVRGTSLEVRSFELSDIPALLLVELVAHALGEFLEFALGFSVVGVDYEALKMPQSPAQVFKPLALLEVARYLCADLPCFREWFCVVEVAEWHEGLVSLENVEDKHESEERIFWEPSRWKRGRDVLWTWGWGLRAFTIRGRKREGCD